MVKGFNEYSGNSSNDEFVFDHNNIILNIDGEIIGQTPVDVSILKDGLDLLV